MYKPLSDSTLMSMTKKEIIENLRIAEHNFFAAEETLAQQAENMRDWAPVAHGHPIYHNRPVYYEHYERADHGENGEPLYRHKCFLLQDNPVAYCSRCGKRLCSRFEDYCPNCGAKMDGKDEDA